MIVVQSDFLQSYAVVAVEWQVLTWHGDERFHEIA